MLWCALCFFFSSRRRHTRSLCEVQTCALPILRALEPGCIPHQQRGLFGAHVKNMQPGSKALSEEQRMCNGFSLTESRSEERRAGHETTTREKQQHRTTKRPSTNENVVPTQ